jgi:hypothetical protein
MRDAYEVDGVIFHQSRCEQCGLEIPSREYIPREFLIKHGFVPKQRATVKFSG